MKREVEIEDFWSIIMYLMDQIKSYMKSNFQSYLDINNFMIIDHKMN